MFDYIFPKKTFVTKSWFHAIPRFFSFPIILICKKWSKYNFTATAKFRRNRFSYSNTQKHAQNWLFWGIFSFFLFLRYIFWELWTHNLLFYSSNVGRNIPNDRYMPQVYIKRNFQIWPKTKLSSLQSIVRGGCEGGGLTSKLMNFNSRGDCFVVSHKWSDGSSSVNILIPTKLLQKQA